MARLNDMQIAAIEDKEPVVVVIAGAGSGKTTVLTQRISYLYKVNNVNPENVLAITFTNKAANEMKERLLEKEGPYAQMSWIMTFHALAVRIIRANTADLKWFDKDFSIIDTDDQLKILKQIIKDLGKDEIKPKEASYVIGNAKSFASTLSEVEYKIDWDYLDIYKQYDKYLKTHNAMDFDDLLLYCHELLKKPAVRTKYVEKFKYIHVDEFQDTSIIQNNILKLLYSKVNNMFIVGDVDQSIYGWRGAAVENMLNIEREYGSSKIIKLEQNYRSTPEILQAANDLISYNTARIEKSLWTDRPSGDKIVYNSFNTMFAETDYVSREIDRMIDYGANLEEIAVLYRSNFQSRKIEEALMKKQIPYKIYGGIRFYERMEIKDIIAYLRLILNQADEIALNRVINVPKRKIGDKTIEKFRNHQSQTGVTLFESVKQLGSKAAVNFTEIIEKYSEDISTRFEFEFVNLLADIKYEEYLLGMEDSSKVEERMQNINEFKEAVLTALKNGKTLREYLNDLAIFSEKDDVEQDSVVLSTIHGVKGLEFDNVFIIGMTEGRFPSSRSSESLEELEEERRLCYVAVTRAKKHLELTSYKYDFKGDYQKPSVFIEEMELSDDTSDSVFDFVI
ncbi:3'-5' exonuclease [Mollicutes bacterium LVI A0078]|nr:3'-5' exonuclease [Mollicutes bacterium LVI A0075]WOO90613.1 3'-5' exonuclease [Mollicutes bacterium LVI A0078]